MTMKTRDFAAICGNDPAKERTAHAIRTSTLPHALLLCGPKGSGKHSFALQIAAAQNCENRNSENTAIPCGICSSCRRILSHNHPDVKTLGKTSGKATIGVGELRLFREDMFLSATEADSKIYLIEDAEDMTPQAQNALLKVLEEPPRGVYIFLLAESTDKILSTVRSRAQLLRMQPIPDEALGEWLKASVPEAKRMALASPDRFGSLIRFSEGRIGRAKELLDPKTLELREAENAVVSDLIEAMRTRAPYTELYRAVQSLPQKREPLCDALELLLIAVRDMIVCTRAEAGTLFFRDSEEAAAAAGRIGERRLGAISDAVSAALDDAGKYVMIPTLLADLTYRIAASGSNQIER